ncbi:MAG: OmpA family protein [Termitinemataceae bacterium]|nr:MAG: OmpA family protein [Termitinemataceae bacterium]
MIIKKSVMLYAIFILFSGFLQAQDNVVWNLTERADFSRYDSGKYVGHVSREVRACINKEGAAVGAYIPYKAAYIVMEATKSNMQEKAQPVNDVINVHYKISNNGDMQIENDRGYPALRNFPVYSTSQISGNQIQVGSKWTASGKRAVDPLNNGRMIVHPIIAEYEYKGTEEYKGVEVYHIFARYSSNYFPSDNTDINLKSITGTHAVDILLSTKNGMLVMQRDTSDETFSWTNGESTRFKGFTLTFGTGLPEIEKPQILTSIQSTPDIDVEKVENGLRLRIKDLKFKSDSDELLPSEHSRLDLIAKTLINVKGRSFLVEGHTASIGNTDNEEELSIARCLRIIKEMEVRGIPSSRFVYKGWGGTKPVGDNDSDEGRKVNRRVEITILQ